MNKMFLFVAAAALSAATSSAAQLDWQYNAKSADVGQTVYVLLGSTAVSEWASIDALAEKSVDNGTITKKGVRYSASGSFADDSVTKTSADVYYVIVSADKSSFAVTSVSDMSGSVYDPSAQESGSGSDTSLTSDSITKSGIAWGTGGGGDPDPGPGPDNPPTPGPGGDGDVPEPTSGILLMIGGAALALRRRR